MFSCDFRVGIGQIRWATRSQADLNYNIQENPKTGSGLGKSTSGLDLKPDFDPVFALECGAELGDHENKILTKMSVCQGRGICEKLKQPVSE